MFGSINLAQLLFSLISATPGIIGEVESAINEHWGKDHIDQVKLGLQHLSAVVDKVDQAMDAGTVSKTPSSVMGSAP